MDWRIRDERRTHRTELRNGVLVHYDLPRDHSGPAPVAAFDLTKATLLSVLPGGGDFAAVVQAGDIRVTGNPAALQQVKELLDSADPEFGIVTR